MVGEPTPQNNYQCKIEKSIFNQIQTSQVQSLDYQRKSIMACGIYKSTNKINNKIYIRQSVNIQQRFYTHCSDALTKQDNNYFHNAIRKYGKENFYIEII